MARGRKGTSYNLTIGRNGPPKKTESTQDLSTGGRGKPEEGWTDHSQDRMSSVRENDIALQER